MVLPTLSFNSRGGICCKLIPNVSPHARFGSPTGEPPPRNRVFATLVTSMCEALIQ